MKTKTLFLQKMITKLLLEIGDLKNIPKYKTRHVGNSLSYFKTEDSDNVVVKFESLPHPDSFSGYLDVDNIPKVFNIQKSPIKFISYTINDYDTQYKKTSLSELLKIINTVVSVITERIKKYDTNPNLKPIYVFSAQDKLGREKQDNQKLKLYKTIINHHLPPNYRMEEIKGNIGYNFIFIQKK